MSLAFTASPFNNENDYVDVKNGDTPITRKKQTNNRTQKRVNSGNNENNGNGNSNGNSEKVNALLASIHNSGGNDSEMGDFNPPSPPQSSGVQNTIIKEQMTNLSQGQEPSSKPSMEPPPYPPHNPNQMFDDEVDMNGFNDKSFAEDYYRKMIPNYGKRTNNMYQQQHDDPHYGSRLHQRNDFFPHPIPSPSSNQYNYGASAGASSGSGDVIEKLNYMINLLEESHDERTGSVTEEVILYSFLGIFIIFIADSFARVGKYTR